MVSVVITEEIRKALESWRIADELTCEGIGGMCGVSKSAASNWLNGGSKTMRKSTWEQLLPHIEKYLPKNFSLPTNNNGAMIVNNGGVNNGNAVSGYYFSQMIKKILDSDKLTAEEKVKVISVLNED